MKARVLNGQGHVQLLDTMPHFKMLGDNYSSLDDAIVSAARASFNKHSYKDVERNKRLIDYLIDHGHTSPLEMVEFKFEMKAPVMVWWHHVRHRMQEMNLQSGRYTPYEEEFYIPKEWRGQSKSNKQGSDGTIEIDGLDAIVQNHFNNSKTLYERMLEEGVAKEQARIVLPGFAAFHTGIVKMNLHAIKNYVDKRTHSDAQWETRQYANAIEGIVGAHLPYTKTRLFK